MRFLWSLLIIYIAFLLQAVLFPVSFDLVLLCVIIFSLHERRLFATALGLIAGLLLDLTAPLSLGANALAFSVVGFLAASIHPIFYRARWYVPLLTVASLALKHAIRFLAGAGLPPLHLVTMSGVITIALSPLVELLLTHIFSHRWQTS